MAKEDLSGRLLQRADIVAQREYLEQILESFRRENLKELELYDRQEVIRSELDAITSVLEELNEKQDECKKKLKEGFDAEYSRILNLDHLKNLWEELCDVEQQTSQRAEGLELLNFEDLYQEAMNKYMIHVDKERVFEFIRNTGDEDENVEELFEDFSLKNKIREEVIEDWKSQIMCAAGEEEWKNSSNPEGIFMGILSRYVEQQQGGLEFLKTLEDYQNKARDFSKQGIKIG